jgi:hypothetical protein
MLQTFAILDACDLSKELADKIKVVYMHSLMKSLLRCGEIAMAYQSEFVKEMEACKRRPPRAIVTVPSIMRLEEECRNFLYEAKNFIRDTLKAFNLLYGTAFEEASEFLWPKKGRPSLIGFVESTFGPEDDKTKLFKQMLQAVERVVTFRNAVEHPGGYSGTLYMRNFRLEPNGKFTEPGWWLEKNGKKESESCIRVDLFAIVQNLLILAEEMIVLWAEDNLRFPQAHRIAILPEERRDPNIAIQYVVTASLEFERNLTDFIEAQGQGT